MLVVLVILLILTFWMRVYFYERSEGDSKTNIYIGLLRRAYSPKYFFLIESNKDDSMESKEYKKKANITLYVFYILFILGIVITFVIKTKQ